MTLHTEAGARLTKAGMPSTPVPNPDPLIEITNDVWVRDPLNGSGDPGAPGDRLLWNAGDHVRQSVIDKAFGTTSIDTVTPATGVAAGGTVVTIKGPDMDMATGVTFGGTPGTAFSVRNSGEVRVTAPAHAAGAVNVVVQADGGNATKTNGYTYT